MNETYVTIVGNALHKPEWRQTTNTGAMVTSFRIASTARRVDRETGRWIDGNSLRVRVTCWRKLAENVYNSVTTGDPLIVTGRLFTRDWMDENKVRRTSYELEATSVGHDLSRGRAVFERRRPQTATSMVEDAEADRHVGGEPTEPVADGDAPTQFNDMPFEVALEEGLPVPVPVGVPMVVDGDSPEHGPTAGAIDGRVEGGHPDERSGLEDGAAREEMAMVGEREAPAPAAPAVAEQVAPAETGVPTSDPQSRSVRRRGLRRSSS